MRGYAHSNCKYLGIIEMHDYHVSKTVLTINDNHEFKDENVLKYVKSPHSREAPKNGSVLIENGRVVGVMAWYSKAQGPYKREARGICRTCHICHVLNPALQSSEIVTR